MIRFTKDERRVLLFLVAALFVGTAVLYHKRLNPSSRGDLNLPCFEKININEASPAQLTSLKNIGPVLAERIVAYRKKHGPFKKPEEIKNVKGIGDKTYERIKEKIVLE